MPDKMTRQKLFLHLRDWKIWTFGTFLTYVTFTGSLRASLALMLMCATVPTYVTGACLFCNILSIIESVQGYFIPIILSTMGYSVRESLLLSAPPGVLAVRHFTPAICTDLTSMDRPSSASYLPGFPTNSCKEPSSSPSRPLSPSLG